MDCSKLTLENVLKDLRVNILLCLKIVDVYSQQVLDQQNLLEPVACGFHSQLVATSNKELVDNHQPLIGISLWVSRYENGVHTGFMWAS